MTHIASCEQSNVTITKTQSCILEKLKNLNQSNNMPHILLYGTNGSGKKTILNQFMEHIYTSELKREYTIQLNCCHQNGIKYIREELKFFGKRQIRKNDIQYKSIVLLNAEFLTIEAQSSLRRMIEIYSNTTRFFIITNDRERIITPIKSRFCNIITTEFIENKVANHYIKKFRDIQIHPDTKMNKLLRDFENNNIDDLLRLSHELYQESYFYTDIFRFFLKKTKDELKIDEFKFKLNHFKKEVRNDTFINFYVLCFFRFDLKCKIL